MINFFLLKANAKNTELVVALWIVIIQRQLVLNAPLLRLWMARKKRITSATLGSCPVTHDNLTTVTFTHCS